ncbi:hypothetical protein P5V15_012696 [Pogonomyrmex californicus]
MPEKPFEKCTLDIFWIEPLTITNRGNKYVLTFQECLTKFNKPIPIPNQEAATVAKEFITKNISYRTKLSSRRPLDVGHGYSKHPFRQPLNFQ